MIRAIFNELWKIEIERERQSGKVEEVKRIPCINDSLLDASFTFFFRGFRLFDVRLFLDIE